VLIHMTLNSNPSLGYTEWYVDGNLRFADHLSTLTQAGDGTTPGIAYEAGLYRASIDTSSNETVYVGPMVAGPTRTSVGD